MGVNPEDGAYGVASIESRLHRVADAIADRRDRNGRRVDQWGHILRNVDSDEDDDDEEEPDRGRLALM